ncbi:acetyl-CoA carboxylase biotin carboxylase subunit [Brevibacterium sp. R8603A2]|uniref:acetyl/propionyl/methylcrotonyl-CoA carboxylase subunit alpha n=1 Tax=Brevibacterium sp. R8603A2 TaxID=2929779 RepID=UPI001FF74400|nr:acetyl-CoA carboxylase biotin carboxylase subunit [Brevibacterium sp. R8603A2]MCK1802832.1 acetyl-CoA carboxylase biotin carboxylase subunit [Brevibacterium sp. R8603A2]
MLFDTVLIANRGEIALRVIRTCRRLGILTVAVYSDADADAAHVRAADTAVRLGPAAASESYLDISTVIDAARATGAQAIHPGYGFLSENAAFAAACEDAGIVFLGPTAAAIRTMGDKITAKQAVAAHGVPLVPGVAEAGLTNEQLITAAEDVGFPVLIKPSAGGGGKGMHAVFDAAELPAALKAARREAANSFGDDTLFLERLVATPRHIEVQVLADEHGTVVHLGERECSLQRRHQKVIEEAPSALLDAAARARIGEAACNTARSVGYRGAGTVEFIVAADNPEEFFFMEMNTRLQVEHPVTEEVTGVDLVEWQLRIGAGERIDFTQDEVTLTGHAIEARIYAEDPARGFLPTGGTALDVVFPEGEGIRVDAGLTAGQRIATDYDPMIAKLIVHAPDRPAAVAKLRAALQRSTVPGIVTNIDFLRTLLSREDVVAGELDTGLIDRMSTGSELEHTPSEADWAFAALAVLGDATKARTSDSVWNRSSSWRTSQPPVLRVPLTHDDEERLVEVDLASVDLARFERDGAGSGGAGTAGAGVARPAGTSAQAPRGREITVREDGVDRRATVWTTRVVDSRAQRPTLEIWVRSESGIFRFTRAVADPTLDPGEAGAEVTAPMPGSVIDVRAADGDAVDAGQPLIVVEAMKMEHVLTAPMAGTLHLHTAAGAQVALDELLATVTDDAGTDTPETSDSSTDAASTDKDGQS